MCHDLDLLTNHYQRFEYFQDHSGNHGVVAYPRPLSHDIWYQVVADTHRDVSPFLDTLRLPTLRKRILAWWGNHHQRPIECDNPHQSGHVTLESRGIFCFQKSARILLPHFDLAEFLHVPDDRAVFHRTLLGWCLAEGGTLALIAVMFDEQDFSQKRERVKRIVTYETNFTTLVELLGFDHLTIYKVYKCIEFRLYKAALAAYERDPSQENGARLNALHDSIHNRLTNTIHKTCPSVLSL